MKEKVIVSLASYPPGMGVVVPTLRSLLNQSVMPDKIILNLTDPEYPDHKIPADLKKLADENPILEIRFYPRNIRSYSKLVPALRTFPDAVIITVDDDVLYQRNMIKNLLRQHEKFPHAIIGYRIKKIRFDKDWNLLPYNSWKRYMRLRYLTWGTRPRYSNFLTGTGGVLYPPHALHPDAMNETLFREMAPTADDVWFWAMAVRGGTKIKPVPFVNVRTKILDKPQTLAAENFETVDRNTAFVRAIIARYPEIMERIKNED